VWRTTEGRGEAQATTRAAGIGMKSQFS